MKHTQKLIKLFVLACIVICQAGYAQINKAAHPNAPLYNYSQVFSIDSLSGFDEDAARNSAISEGFLGEEFKVRMWTFKRTYINNKYNMAPKAQKYKNSTYTNLRTSAVPGCVNEDFEASTAGNITASNQITGWTLSGGTNTFPNTSCVFTTPNAPSESALITAPAGGFIDPTIGNIYPIYSVFGTTPNTGNSANPTIPNMFGNNIIRINNATPDYSIEKLSKTFLVTANNALFQFAFISVFYTGHGCCDAGAFQIKLTNATTNTQISCPSFSVSAPSTSCPSGTDAPQYYNATTGSPATLASSIIFNKWQVSSIDLTPYIGQNITIDVVATDCTGGAHYGYVYFDAQCGPMTIIGNGSPFAAGTPSITLPTCGATGATIIAPGGLGPYSWAGPGVSPPYTTPAQSNQTYTTTISGTYTLTMNPAGACAPIIRVITVTITPAPQVFATVAQAPCGGTVAVASCTTSGSASTPASIVWSPTPVSLNSNTTQATYTIGTGPVMVTVSDALGCTASTTVNINSAPPIPTFTITNVTGSNSITCAHPSINYIAASNYTYGTLTYTWVSLTATAGGTNVTLSNVAQYTVTATDLATSCSTFSVFSIGINTTVPSSTVTPVTQNIACPVTVPATFTGTALSPTINITQSWYSSIGLAATSNSNVSIFSTAGIGTYSYVLLNNINGCSITRTISITSTSATPVFSVSSTSNFTLGCGTKSLSTIQISNGASTIPPGSGPVSYTVVGPSSGAYPGGTVALSGVQNWTINAPGTYTVVIKDNTNYCENAQPVTIISNTAAPNSAIIIPQPTLTCFVPKTTLQGTSTQTPNVTFGWTLPAPNFPNQTSNDTLTVFSSTNTGASSVGTYTLNVTDVSSLCKSTQTITVFQDTHKPTPGIIPAGPLAINCFTATNYYNLGNQSTSNANLPHPLPVTVIDWKGPSPQPVVTNSTTYVANQPGIYTLTVIDQNNGCTAITTKTIGNNIIYPVVNTPNAPPPFILDCAALGVGISAIVSGTTTGYTYQWNSIPTVSFSCYTCATTTVNKPGEYRVVVTGTNGCAADGFVQVVNGSLTGDFSPSATTGYAPLSVTFHNLSASNSPSTPNASITSVWSFGNGNTATTNSVSISPSTTYTNAGTYTVTMYAFKGSCMDTTVKIITVEIPSKLEVPNVFTPNGDGSNDVFFLKVANVTEINALIFDRWGNKVFESNSSTGNIGWDGKNMSGKDASVGTYFYIIKATGKDGTAYDKKGNVSLYR